MRFVTDWGKCVALAFIGLMSILIIHSPPQFDFTRVVVCQLYDHSLALGRTTLSVQYFGKQTYSDPDISLTFLSTFIGIHMIELRGI